MKYNFEEEGERELANKMLSHICWCQKCLVTELFGDGSAWSREVFGGKSVSAILLPFILQL